MKKEEITSRIIAIVKSLKTSWVKHEVTPASNIRDDVELESIDFLDMIQQVEMMFHIKITPEEAKDCKLVSDVIALTEQKVNIQHSTFNTQKSIQHSTFNTQKSIQHSTFNTQHSTFNTK